MNKKDYEEIAEIMKWCPNAFVTTGYKEGLEDGRKHFVISLADYFEKEHLFNCSVKLDGFCHCVENFDREQFIKDCAKE